VWSQRSTLWRVGITRGESRTSRERAAPPPRAAASRLFGTRARRANYMCTTRNLQRRTHHLWGLLAYKERSQRSTLWRVGITRGESRTSRERAAPPPRAAASRSMGSRARRANHVCTTRNLQRRTHEVYSLSVRTCLIKTQRLAADSPFEQADGGGYLDS